MESSFILALQKWLASGAGHALVGLTARWFIYLYVPFMLAARLSRSLKHAVIEALWSAALAFALSTTFAMIIGRVRPYMAIKDVAAIVPPNIQTGSFPSSHTAVAFAIASAIAFKDVPLGIAAFLIAFLIAFGRVAAGMHYPTDVLGGAMLGIIAFFLVRLGHVALASIKYYET